MIESDIEKAAAHRYFAAHCYNETWDWLGKPDRTPDDDLSMVAATLASIYHWQFRDDISDTTRSIGCWQASRVYATIGNAVESQRFAEASLKHAENVSEPFYRGFAYEALARAASLARDTELAKTYLAKAQELAATITDAEERKMLEDDLATVRV